MIEKKALPLVLNSISLRLSFKMQEVLSWLESQKEGDSLFENQIIEKIIELVGEGGFDKTKFDTWLQSDIKESESIFVNNLKKEEKNA